MPPHSKTEPEFFHQVFENAPSVMLIVDPDTGAIKAANNAARAFYGYPGQALMSMDIFQINIHETEDLPPKMLRITDSGQKVCPHRHRLKSGEIKEVDVYSSVVFRAGKPYQCWVVHDVSQINKDKNALLKSERTIRAMINATASLVFLISDDGIFLDMNRRAAELFKCRPSEMIGKKVALFFNETDYKRLKSMTETVLETAASMVYQRERDGRAYEVSLYPIANSHGVTDRICVYTRDITDLKQTEKVLAAVETAGAVCHEMNQPLQVILGNLELLRLTQKKNPATEKFIKTLEEQTERLGRITKKLTHITRYETKEYIRGTIFDIDRSSRLD